MDYNDQELEEYNEYISRAVDKILYLNGTFVKEIDVEIERINKLSCDEWGFQYSLNEKKGTIRFESFNLWLRQKKTQEREEKLNQLLNE